MNSDPKALAVQFTTASGKPVIVDEDMLETARLKIESLIVDSEKPAIRPKDETENIPVKPATISMSEAQEILDCSLAVLEDEDDFTMETDEILLEEPEARPLSFANVVADGSSVEHVRVWVARVYPLVYMCKTPEGQIELDSERAYEKRISNYERERSNAMELLHAQVEEEHAKVVPPGLLASSHLSTSQLATVTEDQEGKRAKERIEIQREVEDRYRKVNIRTIKVVPVLRTMLCDVSMSASGLDPGNRNSHALLTFWRSCEEVRNKLNEGEAIDVFSVKTTLYSGGIRLHSIDETRFQPHCLDTVARSKLAYWLARRCYSFKDVTDLNFAPPFNEFDILGLVVKIEDGPNRLEETVYLANEHADIICIHFKRKLSIEGLEHVVKVGNVVSALNIQWRNCSRRGPICTAYSQDVTEFSLRPHQSHLQESLAKLQKFIREGIHENIEAFISVCLKRIGLLLGDHCSGETKTPRPVHRLPPHDLEPASKKAFLSNT